jgi:ATP-dependent exoDNAse (exonuclease V) alpha subunit
MREGAVVIVDEAGQIGGRQMLALLEAIEAHHGRVILSGDTRQHGPVDASDALRAIERYSGLRAAELNLIRRQNPARAKAKEEREKIRLFRDAVKQLPTAKSASRSQVWKHRARLLNAVQVKCMSGSLMPISRSKPETKARWSFHKHAPK